MQFGGGWAELGGVREPAAPRQLDHLRLLGVHRLELADREDDVAVTAGADLALDVLEIYDVDLGLLRAAGTCNENLEHAFDGAAGIGRRGATATEFPARIEER
jgi:hypothetical protein